MNKKNLKRLIVALGVIFPLMLTAQPNPGQNSNGTPNGGDPIGGGGAPLGTGIGILLALGGAYGAKKVYDIRKKPKE
jgi:hypothetical protein